MVFFARGFELLINSNIQKFHVFLSLLTIPLLARSFTKSLHTILAPSPISSLHATLQDPLPDQGKIKKSIKYTFVLAQQRTAVS